jgi:hypothetical protein
MTLLEPQQQGALPLDLAAAHSARHDVPFSDGAAEPIDAAAWLPADLGPIDDHQTALPR